MVANATALKERYIMTFHNKECEEVALNTFSALEEANHKWLPIVKVMIAEFSEEEAQDL